jgi:hypothetical protein
MKNLQNLMQSDVFNFQNGFPYEIWHICYNLYICIINKSNFLINSCIHCIRNYIGYFKIQILEEYLLGYNEDILLLDILQNILGLNQLILLIQLFKLFYCYRFSPNLNLIIYFKYFQFLRYFNFIIQQIVFFKILHKNHNHLIFSILFHHIFLIKIVFLGNFFHQQNYSQNLLCFQD